MAGGGGGGGDKRSANSELNLVPYIDLLSTLICFLLITAVWQQVSVISTNSSITPPQDKEAFNPNPNQEPPKDKKEVTVKIGKNALEVTIDKAMTPVPVDADSIDKALLAQLLQKAKVEIPDMKEVVINSETGSVYKYLIQVMDVLNQEKIDNVAISTN